MSTDEFAPPRWGWREGVSAVVVAAVIAALGGAAIYAATTGPSHQFGTGHQGAGPPGAMLGGGGHGATGRPGLGDMGPTSLHGEFVVADPAGGYSTELTQTGTVTAISPTSITVRSQDGFTQAYVIPSTGGAP